MRMRTPITLLFFSGLFLSACATQLNLGSASESIGSRNLLTYDGAISLTVKNGQTLAGTSISYQGRSPDGRALVSIGGQQSLKSTADSVNFTGAPAAGAILTVNTRVGTFDSNQLNLLGTVHVSIKDAHPQPGEPAPNQVTAFNIPVSYNVSRNSLVPGSDIQYLGQTPDGANFSNAGGIPFRQQFDSVVWTGHIRDKIGLRLDLRLLNSNADAATLVGLAEIRFEQ